jgi:hypothetical protein
MYVLAGCTHMVKCESTKHRIVRTNSEYDLKGSNHMQVYLCPCTPTVLQSQHRSIRSSIKHGTGVRAVPNFYCVLQNHGLRKQIWLHSRRKRGKVHPPADEMENFKKLLKRPFEQVVTREASSSSVVLRSFAQTAVFVARHQ